MLLLLLACSPDPDSAIVTTAADDTAEAVDTTGETEPEPEPETEPDDTGEDTSDTGGDTEDTGEPDTEPPPLTAAECFADQGLLVDYDQYAPVIGSHCMGTDHQNIFGVEHVVFAGDSITVGTPPTAADDWYRNRMADALADDFGLEAPGWLWENVDLFDGMTYEQDSGAFSSCAKWGARTDDITDTPHEQLQTCIPEDRRDEVTLVVMTVGGNDLFAWAQDRYSEGMTDKELWAAAEGAVADLEASVDWLLGDPERFPNGVYLVFANTFEFTDDDSAMDFSTCTGADWIGMDTALLDPVFQSAASWMMEEYMRIAVQTGADLAFMGEQTCGYGALYDEPTGRCYRGAGVETWLDLTCMHPSAAGHAGIADMFLSVIAE